MNKYILALDIGGTSVKLGLLSESGRVIYKWSIPTNKKESGKYILSECWESVLDRCNKYNIKHSELLGIGVGIPGYVKPKSGFIHEAINIGWKKKQIASELVELTALPVAIENDANLVALGEHWKGAGKGIDHILAVTLGTGVGGGVISNGELVNGINGMAGEIGHIIVDTSGSLCNCGNIGCLETVASATGIVRQAMEIIKGNPNSMLARFYQENENLTSRDVFTLASCGDFYAQKIIDRVAYALGNTFAMVGLTINPEKIVIGGGVAEAGESFRTQIDSYFRKFANPLVKEKCEITFATLGNDAGLVGAAILLMQKMEK
jgi:glucokinase